MRIRRLSSLVFVGSIVLVSVAACSSDERPRRSSSGGDGDGGASSSSGSGSTGSGSTGSSSTGSSSTGSGSTGSSSGGADQEPAPLTGITALHNAARASVDPPAQTPIPPLTWDSTVAAAAQAHASKCMFMHSGNGYGENIYASSGGSTPQDVVSSWVSEVVDYDYASNSCSGVCGHYTQVVWADSLKLGCGVETCTMNSPFGGGSWEFWVCDYDPPGNFNGQKPY